MNYADCDAIFKRQTERNLGTRLNELRKFILKNIEIEGMAEHCIDNNHFMDVQNPELHSVNKGRRIDQLETLEIF